MKETSRGCIRCVQCGGKHTMCTPFFCKTQHLYISCVRTVSVQREHHRILAWLRNCWNHCVKFSVRIKPDLCHVAFVPGGLFVIQEIVVKMTCNPQAVTTVTSESLSTDDNAAICSSQFIETLCCTTERPIPTLCGENC
jgi:hypothetical protein